MNDFRLRFEQAQDKNYWLGINPHLSITDSTEPFTHKPLDIDPQVLEEVKASLREEGYFQIEKLLDTALIQKLAAGVKAVFEAGWPTPFVVVYDEYWELFYSLQQLYIAVLGDGYMQLPNFWCWYVDTNKDSKGWGQHRDRPSVNTVLADGLPATLTTWVPLSRATPSNGCMYVVPSTRDPHYPPGDMHQREMHELQSIRALPAGEGDVLGWTEALLHWGSRSSSKAPNPRISISFAFQRGDTKPYESPLFDPRRRQSMAERLGLIAQNVCTYQNHDKTTPEILSACRRLSGLIPTTTLLDALDKQVVETDTRLSHSILWSKQKELFEQNPKTVWNQNRFYATNRMLFVEACVEMTTAALLDCKNLIDPNQPLNILEIGGGTGCFAHRFLSELKNSKQDFDFLRDIKLKYVLTDYSEKIVEEWQQDRNLKILVDAGLLDFAVYNPQIDKTIDLIISKETLTTTNVKNPLIVVAHHVFDHMEQDAFRTVDHVLQESKLTVLKSPSEEAEESAEHWLNDLQIVERFTDVQGDYYENQLFDSILKTYPDEIEGQATFTFPIGALRSISNLTELSGEKLILISSDEGFIHLDSNEIIGLKPLDFSRDGSISFQLNFDALSKYFKMNDGVSFVEQTDYIGLRFSFASLIQNRFQHTKHFFRHNIVDKNILDPNFEIQELIKQGLSVGHEFSRVPLFLSLVRTFNYDPTIFAIAHKALLDERFQELELMNKRTTDELRETIQRTINNIYIIDENYDIFDSILRLYVQLDWFEDCLKICEEIIETFGEVGTAIDHAAVASESLKRYRDAYEYFQKATRRPNADYEWAKSGMQRMTKELVKQGDSIVRLTLAKAK